MRVRLAAGAVAVVGLTTGPVGVVEARADDTSLQPTSSVSIVRKQQLLAKAVWRDRGDVLCVHAERSNATASMRVGSRTLSVRDISGGRFWSCTDNLDVPEDVPVRLVLQWKRRADGSYARTASVRTLT